MENPFEIILNKLNAIENSISQLQNQLNNHSSTEQELMTVSEVADYLHLTKSAIYGLVQRREIPVIKKSRLYFLKKEINEWLLTFRQKTNAELTEEVDELLVRMRPKNN
ncbi:helix-turn-helix domain-containing protein [Cellulophaga baltica]|uniref:helix-turn-helix domain-containing protein n=1 Tax=Cellulophaga baltica TaxID=76594 RepID=UPI0021478C9D|nr:helix-turn-helix domain-containing protein [Cellulophaga baltica]MCR1025756.1 helix-turn-helix domain-containing protein [Cellulophaga baltica]